MIKEGEFNMGTYNWLTSVNIPSSDNTSANYELLSNTRLRQVIRDRLSITDAELTQIITDGGIGNMVMHILITGSKVSFNNETYQDPFNNRIVTTGDFVRRRINSVRLETSGVGCDILLGIL